MGGQDRGPGPVKNPQEDEVDGLNKELWGTPGSPGAQEELKKANADVDRYRQRIKDDENAISNLKAEGKGHTKEMTHLKDDVKIAKKTLEKKLEPAAKRAARRVDELGRKLGEARKKAEREGRPHDQGGQPCWCGAYGMHGGQPR